METTVYKVRSPDGTIIKVRGPVGASQEQVIAKAKQLAQGASAGAVAAPTGGAGTTPQGTPSVAPSAVQGFPQGIENWDPSQDMNALQRFGVGMDEGITRLGQGAMQLIGNMVGTPEEKEKYRAELAQERELTKGLDDTTSGTLGNVAGNMVATAPTMALKAPQVLAQAPKLIKALTALGIGGAEGAAMSSLAPETQEGERASNMKTGAAFGAAIPLVGAGARAAAGKGDAVAEGARDVLAKYGITVPKADVGGGPVSRMGSFILDRTPVAGAINRNTMKAKQGQVRTALFSMLEAKPPTDKQGLVDIVRNIGDELGGLTKGKRADIAGINQDVMQVLDDYNRLLPTQQNPTVHRLANDLLDLEQSGTAVTGEQYQAMRSALGAHAKASTPQDAKAIRAMQQALDNRFVASAQRLGNMSSKEVERLGVVRSQYELAKALRNVDVKEGGMSTDAIRRAVNRSVTNTDPKAGSTSLIPAAAELMDASTLIRDVPRPNMLNMGVATAGHMIASPLMASLIGARILSNTGLPRGAVNSKTARDLTSRLLRSSMQTNLSTGE